MYLGKKHHFLIAAIASLCALGASPNARAQETPDSTEARTECAIRIGGGPRGKVYELMIKDMQAMCGAEVSICAVPSIGGLPNLMMLSSNQTELGIAQLDTLQVMAAGGDENIAALQAVMPLHTNLLHILALRDGSKVSGGGVLSFGQTQVIRKFSDLRGLKVAVVGSTQLLGQTLNKQTGYAMELLLAETDDIAIKMLQANQVQAVFTDGGWPLPSIANRLPSSGLSLVEFDLPAPPRFSIVQRTYQNLDSFNNKYLGSPNMLVTRPFKASGAMAKKVATLQNCLIRHLEDLKEGRFQAAWKDVKDPLNTMGVTRFSPAAPEKAKSGTRS
jgi:TRAP-type uncharacterized transport system substrate-binding protein